MATLKIQPPKVHSGYSTQHGYQGDEAASQTFTVDNFITTDANGKWQFAAAGAGVVNKPLRVALSAGQNSAAPTRRVEYVTPNEHGPYEITAGGAAASTSNIKVGATYGLGYDSATKTHYLNLADTTNGVFRIVDTQLIRGALGDTNVVVLAEALPGNR